VRLAELEQHGRSDRQFVEAREPEPSASWVARRPDVGAPGAVTPLGQSRSHRCDAAGRQRSARWHPHSGPPMGIALAAGARLGRLERAPQAMSEMIGSRDPPWGALSPLHAAGDNIQRDRSHSRPPTGIALRRLAPGSVDRSVPPGQNERNDRRSRPTLGRALTVAAPLGGNVRRDGIRTRAHRWALPCGGWRSAVGRLERAPQAE
jgi:hypothetical protein